VLDTIFGLPVHPLIVHATVVLVPTAALLVALAAVYPRFRAWIGPVPALAALAACVLVPLSTSSGEELEHHVGDSSLVEKHAQLADTLIWLVLPLALVAVVGWWVHRRTSVGTGAVVAVAVASVVLAGGTLVDVVLIGHSGAKAAWTGVAQQKSSDGSSSGDSD
jgi:hypothetical protein